MSGWLAIVAYQCRVDGVPTGSLDVQVRCFDLPAAADVEAALRSESPCEYRNDLAQTVTWPLAGIFAIHGQVAAESGDEVAGFRIDLDTLSSMGQQAGT